jgi:hypothetical protein
VSEVSVRQSAQPTVFYNEATMGEFAMTLMIRTNRPDATVAPAIAAVRGIDPEPARDERADVRCGAPDTLARERLNALVSSGFALSGLLLARWGLRPACLHRGRAHERDCHPGGARRPHSAPDTSVVGRGLRLVAIGAAVGLAVSLALLRS